MVTGVVNWPGQHRPGHVVPTISIYGHCEPCCLSALTQRDKSQSSSQAVSVSSIILEFLAEPPRPPPPPAPAPTISKISLTVPALSHSPMFQLIFSAVKGLRMRMLGLFETANRRGCRDYALIRKCRVWCGVWWGALAGGQP